MQLGTPLEIKQTRAVLAAALVIADVSARGLSLTAGSDAERIARALALADAMLEAAQKL